MSLSSIPTKKSPKTFQFSQFQDHVTKFDEEQFCESSLVTYLQTLFNDLDRNSESTIEDIINKNKFEKDQLVVKSRLYSLLTSSMTNAIKQNIYNFVVTFNPVQQNYPPDFKQFLQLHKVEAEAFNQFKRIAKGKGWEFDQVNYKVLPTGAAQFEIHFK